MFNKNTIKYKIEWGCCDGRENRYTSDTLEKLRVKIDKDKQLTNDEKNILKYGYDREFIKYIKTSSICIDNGFCVNWYKCKMVY